MEHADELARLIVLENGKSLQEASGEVQRGIESGMYRYPLGVVGGIMPFNFPMMMPCWMFPLVIACGITFVLKPSERTPLLANRLAELFHEAGLPDGVLKHRPRCARRG